MNWQRCQKGNRGEENFWTQLSVKHTNPKYPHRKLTMVQWDYEYYQIKAIDCIQLKYSNTVTAYSLITQSLRFTLSFIKENPTKLTFSSNANTLIKLQFDSNKQWIVAHSFKDTMLRYKFVNTDVLQGFCITRSSQEQPPSSDTVLPRSYGK